MRLLSAKHEVWVLGPQTPVGGRRATRVDEPAAWGVREHARAPPSPSTLCALSAQAIHAAQGEPGREGRGWYPRTQLEEELDPAARTRYQVVEMMHFTGGEIIPRRVLCPWRAHLLASTLPAVARATAACFVRCAWMVGRGLGLLRGASSGWCVRCSPHGCPSVVRGPSHWRRESAGPPFSRLSRPGEHLTH